MRFYVVVLHRFWWCYWH